MMYVMWILVALSILAGDAVHATQLTNIILLTVDTFRADRIGYYGNPRGPESGSGRICPRRRVFPRGV